MFFLKIVLAWRAINQLVKIVADFFLVGQLNN